MGPVGMGGGLGGGGGVCYAIQCRGRPELFLGSRVAPVWLEHRLGAATFASREEALQFVAERPDWFPGEAKVVVVPGPAQASGDGR